MVERQRDRTACRLDRGETSIGIAGRDAVLDRNGRAVLLSEAERIELEPDVIQGALDGDARTGMD